MLKPQPDFGVIPDRFASLGEEFSAKCADIKQELSLCGNMPAIMSGAQILDSLDDTNQNLREHTTLKFRENYALASVKNRNSVYNIRAWAKYIYWYRTAGIRLRSGYYPRVIDCIII